MRTLLALSLLGLCGVTSAWAAGLPLRTVADVRALGPDEAQQHLPVQLQGVVTFYSASDGHAFLQDETGGVFFRPGLPGDPGRQAFQVGERVQISGVTMQGRFSPSVAGASSTDGVSEPVKVERLGPGELPSPPLITADQLLSGAFHDQYVRVRATLRQAELHSDHAETRLSMTLSFPGGREGQTLRAFGTGFRAVPPDWENTVAEIRGVVAGGGDARAQLKDVRLLVAPPSGVLPEQSMMRETFAQEPADLSSFFRYRPPDLRKPSPYVRTVATVTFVDEGKGLYLMAGDSFLWVQTSQRTTARPGDELDLIGMPTRDESGGFLQDVIYRVLGHQLLPPPPLVTATQAASDGMAAARIAIEGELTESFLLPEGQRLILKEDGHTFAARLAGKRGEVPRPLHVGSRLRVTGVREPRPAETLLPEAALFTLRIGSADDVALLRAPAWLTAPRLRWLAGTLLGGLALCGLWLYFLRREVTRQTVLITQETEFRTLAEERSRIARELHDTLEQQLIGVHLHLESAEDFLGESSPKARHALGAARAMLRHSRSETHQAVFTLRSPVLESLGLLGALRHLAAELGENTPTGIEVAVQGTERRLPRRTEFHLFRVAQEAVTNALKHAGASRIEVALEFKVGEVQLVIRDDGCGFDVPSAGGREKMHFGLLGLRERVHKLHGSLTIESQCNQGTAITVCIPSPAQR